MSWYSTSGLSRASAELADRRASDGLGSSVLPSISRHWPVHGWTELPRRGCRHARLDSPHCAQRPEVASVGSCGGCAYSGRRSAPHLGSEIRDDHVTRSSPAICSTRSLAASARSDTATRAYRALRVDVQTSLRRHHSVSDRFSGRAVREQLSAQVSHTSAQACISVPPRRRHDSAHRKQMFAHCWHVRT
jgi:hypothetical protein